MEWKKSWITVDVQCDETLVNVSLFTVSYVVLPCNFFMGTMASSKQGMPHYPCGNYSVWVSCHFHCSCTISGIEVYYIYTVNGAFSRHLLVLALHLVTPKHVMEHHRIAYLNPHFLTISFSLTKIGYKNLLKQQIAAKNFTNSSHFH